MAKYIYAYQREYLTQYGVEDRHQYVCEWVADDGQSSIVVGLGATKDEALDDAYQSEARGEYELAGGRLCTIPIFD